MRAATIELNDIVNSNRMTGNQELRNFFVLMEVYGLIPEFITVDTANKLTIFRKKAIDRLNMTLEGLAEIILKFKEIASVD